jgi:hypothetical protein
MRITFKTKGDCEWDLSKIVGYVTATNFPSTGRTDNPIIEFNATGEDKDINNLKSLLGTCGIRSVISKEEGFIPSLNFSVNRTDSKTIDYLKDMQRFYEL